ncbi:hypothetical protein [Mailhella sp.]
MDEKRLHDGFPLGFIEKKTFGRVYTRAVEAEFRAKHPGRDFDDALWEACGLSFLYLEGDEEFFYLGEFIRKMELNEQAVKAECERQGFDYGKKLKHWHMEELRSGELCILAASDADTPENSPLLLGLCRKTDRQDSPQILHLWTLDVDDGELWALRDFPLRLHQSFYAHSVGSCSVNAPCPPKLAEQVRRVLSGDDWNGKWKKGE